MITFPNAKINLGLNIVEKRPDGYHNLETIFYPINLQDALEVTRRENNDKEYTLHISGSSLEGEPEDNLVVKAYTGGCRTGWRIIRCRLYDKASE